MKYSDRFQCGLDHMWQQHRGIVLVVCSQCFTAMMALAARILETNQDNEHDISALQVVFVRQLITFVLCNLYLAKAKPQDAPWGKPAIQPLLWARGFFGFFGIFGFYQSLEGLPIAEATVLTFLAPLFCCFACSIIMKETLTKQHIFAAIISILGVLFIAQPTSLLPAQSSQKAALSDFIAQQKLSSRTSTAAKRLVGVVFAMVCVFGYTGAYTTIRCIGKRAAPMIVVTYFSGCGMIICGVSLLLVPGVDFTMPSELSQWLYLVFIGCSGFAEQLCLTSGLSHRKGAAATIMIYTQLLFALLLDKLIWGNTPGIWSIIGGLLILGSAIFAAIANDGNDNSRKGAQLMEGLEVDESQQGEEDG